MLTISESEFVSLSNYIKKYYGIDLTQKKGLVEGRLNSLVLGQGFHSLSGYLEEVFANPKDDEAKRLISKLTTNYTYFMREATHFHYFKEQVLHYLKTTLVEKDLRIWSAGCSTGEEPYTLAMIIQESFGHNKPAWDTQILATDISVSALEQAKKGVYSVGAIEALPDVWKTKYLTRLNEENWEVCNIIKNEVVFRTFNLMDEIYPFKKKFHVIFCRNVMIYFDVETKKKLVQKLYQHTEPGGYLFIGHSESLNKYDTDFQYIMPSVYRKV